MFYNKTRANILLAAVVLGAISLGCTATSDEEKNMAAMRRFYDEVMSQGNLKAIDELVAENFVDHNVPDRYAPTHKTVMAKTMSMTRTAFPDLQVTVEDIVAKGDKVWAYTIMRGTNKGEFMGRPATGKTIEVKMVGIFRFVNGKVVELWNVNDSLTMMQQLEATEWREPTK